MTVIPMRANSGNCAAAACHVPSRSERADMHLVDDLALQCPAAPCGVRPWERCRVDDAGRAVRAVRLEARCGIGMKIFAVIHPKPVTSVRADFGRAGKISVLFGRKRMKRARGVLRRARLENKIDPVCFRGPDSKMGFIGPDQFGADGIAALAQLWRARLASIAPAPIGWLNDFSFHPHICN